MKKITFYVMITILSLTVFPNQIIAKEIVPTAISNTNKEIPAEVKVLLDRLNEIKAMDKSALTRVEKKALRKEVRSIKSTLRSSGNGVYLSSKTFTSAGISLFVLLIAVGTISFAII